MQTRAEYALQFDDPDLAADNEPVAMSPAIGPDRLSKAKRLNGRPCHMVKRIVTYGDWEPA